MTRHITESQRTVEALEAKGYLVDITERRITRKVKKDLYGFIDMVALDGQPGLLGVQATDASHHAARVKKILYDCEAQAVRWLEAGNRIEVWSWRDRKDTGWTARVEDVTLEAWK